MISNLKEVCGAVWNKKDPIDIGVLLMGPGYTDKKTEMPKVVSEVLEQMNEMKKYGYEMPYLDQVKRVFVETMREDGFGLEEIKPVLESIESGTVKYNTARETAIFFRDKKNLDAVEELRPLFDVTGGARGIVSSY